MAILFANNAEALMGSTEDPPDGGAVARTCIGAVIVYSVRLPLPSHRSVAFWGHVNPGRRAQALISRFFSHSVDVKSFYIDGAGALN